MSRIGKKPISVPKGTKVQIEGAQVTVTGPKGTLETSLPPGISMALEDGALKTVLRDESRVANAMSGLARSLVSNMVVGVNSGFRRRLVIEGVGYKADEANGKLTLSVGYSNPVVFPLPAGVTAKVEKATSITLESIDKDVLGQTAAKIRAIRPPEPYKGKGIRYENEHIVKKAGKAGAK